MNVGMISARTPAITASPESSVAAAPSGRGTPRCSSHVAPDDSGIEMITVIRTASIRVASWRNSRPSTSSTAARTTAL
jgi:hypothetical protein